MFGSSHMVLESKCASIVCEFCAIVCLIVFVVCRLSLCYCELHSVFFLRVVRIVIQIRNLKLRRLKKCFLNLSPRSGTPINRNGKYEFVWVQSIFLFLNQRRLFTFIWNIKYMSNLTFFSLISLFLCSSFSSDKYIVY